MLPEHFLLSFKGNIELRKIIVPCPWSQIGEGFDRVLFKKSLRNCLFSIGIRWDSYLDFLLIEQSDTI